MSGFMILCANCGATVKLTEGTNVALSPIVIYNTGIACNCGNEIEVNAENFAQEVRLAE